MEGSKKPWENDEEILKRGWIAASKHRGGPIKDHSQVQALVLIQDGNMGGSYVRVIGFSAPGGGDTNYTTSFQIYNEKGAGDAFYFDKPVCDMKAGDLVVNQKSGLEYMVTRIPHERFYRVLEPTQLK